MSWFLERGLPSYLIQGKAKKVKITRSVNNRNRGKAIKGVPFVLNHHPKLKSLNEILTKNLYLLYMDKEAEKVSLSKLLISFRSTRKLNNYLV